MSHHNAHYQSYKNAPQADTNDSNNKHLPSGTSPLPEAQSSLAPSSPVAGGRVSWNVETCDIFKYSKYQMKYYQVVFLGTRTTMGGSGLILFSTSDLLWWVKGLRKFLDSWLCSGGICSC